MAKVKIGTPIYHRLHGNGECRCRIWRQAGIH